MSDTTILLAMIKECIRSGRFAIHPHGLPHCFTEGFTPSQALEAILGGEIIEHYESESRCLICGTASGLQTSTVYLTPYIHCVCAYDNINQVVIITMYRPKTDSWINHFRRRPMT